MFNRLMVTFIWAIGWEDLRWIWFRTVSSRPVVQIEGRVCRQRRELFSQPEFRFSFWRWCKCDPHKKPWKSLSTFEQKWTKRKSEEIFGNDKTRHDSTNLRPTGESFSFCLDWRAFSKEIEFDGVLFVHCETKNLFVRQKFRVRRETSSFRRFLRWTWFLPSAAGKLSSRLESNCEVPGNKEKRMNVRTIVRLLSTERKSVIRASSTNVSPDASNQSTTNRMTLTFSCRTRSFVSPCLCWPLAR